MMQQSLSPTHPLWSKIGCPESFNLEKTDYVEGDTVENEGIVYECLVAGWCNTRPGLPLADWPQAWDLLGSCSGTIAPSISPTPPPSIGPVSCCIGTFNVLIFPVGCISNLLLFMRQSFSPTYPLWDKIGCPDPFISGTEYNVGDTVEAEGKVFEVSEPNAS